METLDHSKWKRNKAAINSKLIQKGSMVIAKEDLSIFFPGRFVDKKLTVIKNSLKALGALCIKDDKNNYAVLLVPGHIPITPNELIDIELDGEHYYEVKINKGQPIFDSTTIVADMDLVYSLFELFILQGKVPWYMEYLDLIKFFSKLPKYSGTKVGNNTLSFEMFIAMAARDINNPEVEYRTLLTKESDMNTKPLKWIGLQNIYYSFRSTLAKVGGSYFKQGLLAANVNHEQKATDLENILRK